MDVSLIDIYDYTIIFQVKNSGFRTFGNWMNNAFKEKIFCGNCFKKSCRATLQNMTWKHFSLNVDASKGREEEDRGFVSIM